MFPRRPLRAKDKQRLFVLAMIASAVVACLTVAYPAIVHPDPKLTRDRQHMRVKVTTLAAPAPTPGQRLTDDGLGEVGIHTNKQHGLTGHDRDRFKRQ